MMSNESAKARLCLGVILGAHGVDGKVRIKSFTEDPKAIADYGTLSDAAGEQCFQLTLCGRAKGMLLAKVSGVASRDAAEVLAGTELFVSRDALPEPEPEEYYHTDLIGLAVEDLTGADLGRVKAVHDFGAGAILEIAQPCGKAWMLPFTEAAVPRVELEPGRLVVDPPQEVEAPMTKAPKHRLH